MTVGRTELQQAVDDLNEQVASNDELSEETKRRVAHMLNVKYKHTWKDKYDLQEPAALPPMKITLKQGAAPKKIRRHYRWTQEQKQFLRKLLKKLVDVGIISRTESEWCSPCVLVVKQDGTWRLCIDPTELNKQTVPMTWEIPRIREQLQESLHGMR